MAETLTPALSDIRFRYDFFSVGRTFLLSDAAFRALVQIVGFVAADMVWTYTPPGMGALPDDDRALSRIAGCSFARWKKIRSEIERFFTISGGEWLLNEPWIEIGGGLVARVAIPSRTREIVAQREGRLCTYCGATDRPLEYDHIFPVSKGGTNDPSNLTLACDSCNRSKRDRTLGEWMRG